MVGQEAPGVHGERALLDEVRQSGNEVGAIDVVAEDRSPLDPPHHDMVEGIRRIETRLAGHDRGNLAKLYK
jgi:hypothetical protein